MTTPFAKISAPCFLATLSLVFIGCGCWDTTSDHCKEENESLVKDIQQEYKMCKDPVAYNQCLTEQRELLASQQGTSTNIDSLCSAKVPEIKCKDQDAE